MKSAVIAPKRSRRESKGFQRSSISIDAKSDNARNSLNGIGEEDLHETGRPGPIFLFEVIQGSEDWPMCGRFTDVSC